MIESARTRDRLVMACPYAKSLHDEFPVSLAQDMSLLDNWPLLISFEHRAKRNKYTWNARCSYKMQEKQQDEILSLVVGTETGNRGCCRVFRGSLFSAASSNQISEEKQLSTSHQWHSCHPVTLPTRSTSTMRVEAGTIEVAKLHLGWSVRFRGIRAYHQSRNRRWTMWKMWTRKLSLISSSLLIERWERAARKRFRTLMRTWCPGSRPMPKHGSLPAIFWIVSKIWKWGKFLVLWRECRSIKEKESHVDSICLKIQPRPTSTIIKATSLAAASKGITDIEFGGRIRTKTSIIMPWIAVKVMKRRRDKQVLCTFRMQMITWKVPVTLSTQIHHILFFHIWMVLDQC